ncbi:MAG: aldose 1-epimerase family protein [Bacteroidota bacterium]|nr:aldose 1-epimerase family protein [Bacteroidota bacterium]
MTKLFYLKYIIITCILIFSSKEQFAQNESFPDTSIVTISNKQLIIKISVVGAELQNITSRKSSREYLWQGNPDYWGQRAPILFPFIGRLWKGGYNLEGKRYSMGVHGFAKDYVFELVRKKDSEAWFRLTSNEQMLKIYPFPFELTIGYILESNKLKVVWDVKNTGHSEMFFQIGGHPGFNYPDYNKNDSCHTYLSFDKMDMDKDLTYVVKESAGFLNPDPIEHVVSLDKDGLLPVSQELFKNDAIIFQNYQVRKVTMYDLNRDKYLSVEFDIPVFTLWSTPNKKAPFICIEPLWGRIDEMNMTKDMKERAWTQHISPEERFITSYEIEIF